MFNVTVQTSEVLAEDSGWLKQGHHEVKVKRACTTETSEVFSTISPDHLNSYSTRIGGNKWLN